MIALLSDKPAVGSEALTRNGTSATRNGARRSSTRQKTCRIPCADEVRTRMSGSRDRRARSGRKRAYVRWSVCDCTAGTTDMKCISDGGCAVHMCANERSSGGKPRVKSVAATVATRKFPRARSVFLLSLPTLPGNELCGVCQCQLMSCAPVRYMHRCIVSGAAS